MIYYTALCVDLAPSAVQAGEPLGFARLLFATAPLLLAMKMKRCRRAYLAIWLVGAAGYALAQANRLFADLPLPAWVWRLQELLWLPMVGWLVCAQRRRKCRIPKEYRHL